ncbi:hypothetical protein SeLEV6574_g03969 [Synchytrium endobioticum]|nr:hypothetical protein SeLEV6574_g03969 [Synchytrium endobioticum]
MSPTQTQVVANRPHDYLYDNTYTVANRADHVKAMAASTRADVVIVPNYSNMFSALGHRPAATMRLRPHPPPAGLGQDRLPHGDAPQVAGADRYRYFRRPLVPYMPNTNGPIVYARAPSAHPRSAAAERVPRTRTVFVQTTYRESDAQTDPYSPDYITIPTADGQLPQVLALLALRYAHGLPAGVHELELIERARAKRAWEASLPAGTDPVSLQRRRKAMEAMELAEWAEREAEIAHIQNARLQIIEAALRTREDEHDKHDADRIEKMWERRMRAREILLDKIQRKRDKAVRKLTENLRNVENKLVKRDIISDYADHGSRVYAPKARDGMPVTKIKNHLKLHLPELHSYQGLVELEQSLLPQALQPDLRGPESLLLKQRRPDMALHEELNAMDKRIKERRAHEALLEQPLRFCTRIAKPVQRPATPTVAIRDADDEEKDQAALFLQRLVRGRVVQEEMRRGVVRRRDLIAELRARHMIRRVALLPDPATLQQQTSPTSDVALAPPDVEYAAPADDILFQPQPTPASRLDGLVTAALHSEHTARALAFLTNELVRLREERRIAALLKLATRTRQEREAAESAKRLEELERQEQSDAVFMNVMKVHHESVDVYLEDLIRESIDGASDELAMEQVYEHAVRVDTEARNANDLGNMEGGSVARDLVSQFLIPEVERETVRQRLRNDQRRYLLAAHASLTSQLASIEQQSASTQSHASFLLPAS